MSARLFQGWQLTKMSSCWGRVGALWLAAVVVGGLTACGATGQWPPSAAADAQTSADARQRSRVLFYREAGVSPQARVPVNLYIDGHYQASLLGNGYTEQVLCVGEREFAAHFADGRSRSVALAQAFRIHAAAVQYFRLIEDTAGTVQIVPVTSDVAARLVFGLQLQTQTLSRVVRQDCPAR